MKKEIRTENRRKISISEKVENFAKQCLTDTLGLDLIFRKDRYGIDRPDLITKDENLGIEITIGLTGESCKIIQLFRKESKNNDKQSSIKKLNIKDCQFINGTLIASDDISRETIITCVYTQYLEKLKNLNDDEFTKYPTNGLLIYVSCFDEDIEMIMYKIRNTEFHKYNFDTIYFLNNNHLHIYQNNYLFKIIDINTKREL